MTTHTQAIPRQLNNYRAQLKRHKGRVYVAAALNDHHLFDMPGHPVDGAFSVRGPSLAYVRRVLGYASKGKVAA